MATCSCNCCLASSRLCSCVSLSASCTCAASSAADSSRNRAAASSRSSACAHCMPQCSSAVTIRTEVQSIFHSTMGVVILGGFQAGATAISVSPGPHLLLPCFLQL